MSWMEFVCRTRLMSGRNIVYQLISWMVPVRQLMSIPGVGNAAPSVRPSLIQWWFIIPFNNHTGEFFYIFYGWCYYWKKKIINRPVYSASPSSHPPLLDCFNSCKISRSQRNSRRLVKRSEIVATWHMQDPSKSASLHLRRDASCHMKREIEY